MNQLDEKQLQVHIPVVGWLFIVSNAILLAVGLFVFMLLTGIGVATRDAQATMILSLVGTSVAAFLVALSIPGFIAGIGLLAHKSWARVLGVVVAALGMINFPLGTLLGIYEIWVLLQDATTSYFANTHRRMETARNRQREHTLESAERFADSNPAA